MMKMIERMELICRVYDIELINEQDETKFNTMNNFIELFWTLFTDLEKIQKSDLRKIISRNWFAWLLLMYLVVAVMSIFLMEPSIFKDLVYVIVSGVSMIISFKAM